MKMRAGAQLCTRKPAVAAAMMRLPTDHGSVMRNCSCRRSSSPEAVSAPVSVSMRLRSSTPASSMKRAWLAAMPSMPSMKL